jgi:hypothetical protein
VRSIFSAEPARGWIPWGLSAPVLGFAFIIGPALAVSVILADFGILDKELEPAGFVGLLGFLTFPFAATGLVTLLWVAVVERRPMVTVGLSPRFASSFVSGHLIGIAMISSVAATIWLFGGYEVGAIGKAFADGRALASIGLLLLAFLLQASVEEIVFRGWLLSAITRKLGLVAAIVLSGALFTLLHFDRGQPLLATANVFLFALFASAWALRAGNIWGVMGWHAGWNWMLAVAFELPVTGIDANVPALAVKLVPRGAQVLTGGAQGPEGSIFCGILLAAGALGLLVSRGKSGGPPEVAR